MTQVASYGGAVMLHSFGLMVPQAAASSIRQTLSWLNTVLDATGERVSLIGHVTLADRGTGGTRTISSSGGKIYCFSGTVTWADTGTALDVGIQDLAAGGTDPDGTFDVKGTFVPGTDTVSSNSVNTFAMETGSKSLSHGQLISVTFDMTARAGADSFTISLPSSGGGSFPTRPYNRFGVGSAQASFPNVLIEFDDGTYGWFAPYLFRPNTATTFSFASNTGTADEYGSRIKLPWPADLEAISIPVTHATGAADYEVCVYSDILGTPTLLATATTVDATQMGSTSGDPFTTITFDSPLVLAAGTVYGWTVRPTTTASITLTRYTFGANAQMASLGMGREAYQIARLDNAGAFTTDDVLHIPHILHLGRLSDGAGGGGGGGGQRVIGG